MWIHLRAPHGFSAIDKTKTKTNTETKTNKTDKDKESDSDINNVDRPESVPWFQCR